MLSKRFFEYFYSKVFFSAFSAGKVNILGTRSITGTLEKWGNEIFNEGKDILMYQPHILLPDYTGYKLYSK